MLRVSRASLDATITVIVQLFKGDKFDLPKVVMLAPNLLLTASDTTFIRLPLITSGTDNYSLTYKDILNIIAVFSSENTWLEFSQERDYLIIKTDLASKIKLAPINDLPELKTIESALINTHFSTDGKTLIDIYNRTESIVSSDHPEYEALFLTCTGRVLVTDTIKILSCLIANYRLYNLSQTETIKIPWRLIRGLVSFIRQDKNNLPITISKVISESEIYIEAKIGRHYWISTKANLDSTPIIDKATSIHLTFENSLTLNREDAVKAFEQFNRFLAKEPNPYVTLTISEKGLVELAALLRSTDTALTKTLRPIFNTITSNTAIQFNLQPRHIISALAALKGQRINLNYSESQSDPIELNSEPDQSNTKILIAKMDWTERE
jgi:hypothetical protein